MSDPEVQRSLGRLEEAVETLKDEVASMREEMRSVVKLADQVKGGWKTLAGVGAIASAVSAGVTSVIFKMKGGG
jgi:hypothetical protein